MKNQMSQYLNNYKLKIIKAKMYRKEKMLSNKIVVLVVNKRKVKRRIMRMRTDEESQKKMRMMKMMKKKIKTRMIKLE